jgi:hypothetical protein
MTRRTIRPILAAALVVVVAACGDDGGGGGAGGETAAADPSESAYCNAAIDWAIHELTPVDDTDPAAFRAYWTEYRAFEAEALDAAPDELRAAWELKIETEDTTVTPVFEKYDFDVNVMMESATPQEQAIFDAPPDVQAAQDRILAYESEVCGAQQPLAADVSYASEAAGPYCRLVAGQSEQAAQAVASGDAAAVEAVFNAMEETTSSVTDAAPAAIKDDVVDVAAWTNGRQRDVAERYDYDFRAALREGSTQDRYDLKYADEEIREQFARVLAYEEQVCGG